MHLLSCCVLACHAHRDGEDLCYDDGHAHAFHDADVDSTNGRTALWMWWHAVCCIWLLLHAQYCKRAMHNIRESGRVCGLMPG